MAGEGAVQQVLLTRGEFRSAGVGDEDMAEFARVREAFGAPPGGTAFEGALVVVGLDKWRVAIVRVIDQPLRFHALIIGREDYLRFAGCDPFWVGEQFPPDWSAAGELPELAWSGFNPDRRTVESLQEVLKTGDSPMLLGVVQAVVDNGKVVFERPAPDPSLVRNVWSLLPYSTRAERTFATYAFSTALGCDVMVVPKADPLPEGFLTEANALDYPEGRYEKHLQTAVEAGNQVELDRLLWRRSSAQTLRLALWLVLSALVVSLIMRVLFGPIVR